MVTQIDELEIRDLLANNGQIQDLRNKDKAILKIVNGLDQSVDVSIYSTSNDDKAFAEAIETHTKTVASGGSDYLVVSDPWSYLRPSGICTILPTSGALKLVWIFR